MTDYDKTATPDLPMKWHKFIAYFALWVGALSDLGQAGMLMTGGHYGSMRDQVYRVFDGLKTIDSICAVAYVFLAAFAVYTAIQLIKLKENAPGKLMINYVISTAVPLVYVLMASVSTGLSVADLAGGTFGSSVVGCVVGMIICKVYYGKRSHLFVN